MEDVLFTSNMKSITYKLGMCDSIMIVILFGYCRVFVIVISRGASENI